MGEVSPASPARPGVRLWVRDLAPGGELRTIDITSTAALAMLEGFLYSGMHVGKSLSWRSLGYGVRRRDTLGIKPLGE
jgi:hypothetical protein